jgi:flagellar hook-associated protein 2
LTISSPGIGSNLDVNSIVTQLMQVESQPLTTLAQKEASYQAKVSAYGGLTSAVATFQSAVSGLIDPVKFQSVTAVPADSTIFTASSTSQAVAGTYSVNVTQLAQAQNILTAGVASTTASIGDGTAATVTLQFGTISGTLVNGVYSNPGTTFTQDPSQGTGTVTINSSNNSLGGIRDAINAAKMGVTATIVSDGAALPNHLVLTSNTTGANSGMKISVSGGDGSIDNLLGYDATAVQHMTQSSAAQNAALTVNGIAITSATNTVSGAVQGVTLSVAKAGLTTLAVARDTSSVQSAINVFVKGYNDLNTTLKNLTSYNADTKQAGALLGDPTVRTIQSQIRKLLSSPVPGLGGSLATLSQIGVSFQKDGSLAVDSTKLQSAITSNFSDIAGLLATIGKTTDNMVTYVSSTAASTPGSYPVYISALATQGALTGNVDLNAAPTVIGANTTVSATVDGTSASVALTAGSYTSAQLAAMVQSAINGTSAFSTLGSKVSASVDSNGYLNIVSSRYGSASNVSLASGTGTSAASLIGVTPPAGIPGVDVAGTINGVAAIGAGQNLSGATGSTVDGLKLLISGGVAGAARGTINFSQGYAHQLNNLMAGYLGTSGMISGSTVGINASIKDIAKSRDEMNLRLAATEKRYRAQFTALDVLISNMTTTSTFLTQQLAALNNQTKL